MNERAPDPFGLVGRTLAGKHLIERAARQSRFALIYQGRHAELQTKVALKVLAMPEGLQGEHRAEFLERFAREARLVAELRHPAIARVLDVGEVDVAGGAVPWMALEWLDGVTLEDDLASRPGGGRSPREALALLRPAFEALACAHESGVAHRDVKPANMMLVKARAGDAPLRLLDFGVAKVMEPEERAGTGFTGTRSEVTAFSLLYAAPEQVSRARTGPWTDVHALALVLTEVLLGAPAYRATEPTRLSAEIVDRDRPTPGRRGLDVGAWEAVLERALALRPADRHPDAGALLAALDATADDAQAAWDQRRSRNSLAATMLSIAPPVPVVPGAPVPLAPVVVRPSPGRPALWVALGVAMGAALLAITYAAARPARAPSATATASPPPPAETAVTPVRLDPPREAPAAAPSAPPTVTAPPAPPAPRPVAPAEPAARPASPPTRRAPAPPRAPSSRPTHRIVLE